MPEGSSSGSDSESDDELELVELDLDELELDELLSDCSTRALEPPLLNDFGVTKVSGGSVSPEPEENIERHDGGTVTFVLAGDRAVDATEAIEANREGIGGFERALDDSEVAADLE